MDGEHGLILGPTLVARVLAEGRRGYLVTSPSALLDGPLGWVHHKLGLAERRARRLQAHTQGVRILPLSRPVAPGVFRAHTSERDVHTGRLRYCPVAGRLKGRLD